MKYVKTRQQLNEKNITNNYNFKRWFGESKVVDNDDKPLVVYHGTSYDIKEFDPEYGGDNTLNNIGGAFYFTNMPEVALDYAKHSYGVAKDRNFIFSSDEEKKKIGDYAEKEGLLNVIAVYLKIENPLVLSSEDGYVDTEKSDRYVNFLKNPTAQTDEELWMEFYEKAKYRKNDIEIYHEEIIEKAKEIFDKESEDDITKEEFEEAIDEYVMETGAFDKELPTYDGIIWYNVYDMITTESAFVQNVYIALHPNQIKSATKNNGNFNLYKNNIYEYKQFSK
jgi:hypothetical protein